MRALIKNGKQNIISIISYIIIIFLVKLMWEFSSQLQESNAVIQELKNNVSQLMLKQTMVEKTTTTPKPIEQIVQYNKYFKSGLLVDWWFDVCFERTTWDRTWHPLFPFISQKTTTTTIAGDDERTVGNFLRRFSGFIYSNTSEYYEFKLLSRDGAEVLLLDTEIQLNINSKPPVSLDSAKEKLYLKLTKRVMDIQDQKLSLSEMFFTEPGRVWLDAHKLYFVEIVQGGKHFAKAQLHWKRIGDNDFRIIGKDNLLFADAPKSSKILEKSKLKEKYPVSEQEQRRNSFYKLPRLQSNTAIENSNFACDKLEQKPVVIKKLYEGYWHYVDPHVSHPKEYFTFMKPAKEQHVHLPENEANEIGQKTFERLNEMHDNDLKLLHIVHVEKNLNTSLEPYKDWKKTLYFVELDVERTTNNGERKTFRSSEYVQLTPDGVCFVPDYEWKENVQIYLITPIRNQKVWLSYLIYMLKELKEETKEQSVKLILVDCGSTDGNYETILKGSGLDHDYLWLDQEEFSKVKALNHGLNHIKDNNSIAFILDLHLQLPVNMFDRIRKFTIQGKVAFSPTLLKLECGEHEQYTNLKKSQWLDVGTGMMALYKSDWITVGGYNEVLFDKRWGGEDWELIDRIVGNGLRVVHFRMQRFYHIHHARKGSWYATPKPKKRRNRKKH